MNLLKSIKLNHLYRKFMCYKYKNTNASNDKCMGFSYDWNNTHEMCLVCHRYHQNKEEHTMKF